MARVKRTITQRDFSRMEVREDFLEADDLDLRVQSVQSARNMRSLASRAAEARPGTFYEKTLDDARDMIEITPASNLNFGILINDTSLVILDANSSVVHSIAPVPWSSAQGVYVETFREKAIIGGEWGIRVLTYDAGAWSFDPFTFSDDVGGKKAQPYWAYHQTATIRPSGRTGSISITASEAIWTDAYVGQRLRYAQHEILITARVSATVVTGSVVERLPPTYNLTVADGGEYAIGEAVIGTDSGFQGVVHGISGNTLTVLTLANFEGPDVNEKLSGEGASSKVTAKASVSPTATVIWDEPLMSNSRGWPRAASAISGRLVFVDFPQVPDLICLSSSRSIEDFGTGAADDDAIVRQVGDNSPRWLHAINASDLLLFSDRGCYYVATRDGGIISPTNFNPVLFNKASASPVRPVQVDDGVVFVEGSGETVAAALLEGDYYRKWSVRTLTTLHNHLVRSPQKLCGPALSSPQPEKYVFVVNGDGTLAALSWEDSLGSDGVGFAPWDTQGAFVSVSPVFGEYFAIVDRETDLGTLRFLERFSTDAVVDCAVESTIASANVPLTDNSGTPITDGTEPIYTAFPYMQHLAGASVMLATASWSMGPYPVLADGTVDGAPAINGERQVGLPFICAMQPWPVEVIDSLRAGMLRARVIRVSVSVQGTAGFSFVCNGRRRRVGGYAPGDDFDAPPPLRTQVYRFPVMGNRDHPKFTIERDMPGAFRVLAITQEVQA